MDYATQQAEEAQGASGQSTLVVTDSGAVVQTKSLRGSGISSTNPKLGLVEVTFTPELHVGMMVSLIDGSGTAVHPTTINANPKDSVTKVVQGDFGDSVRKVYSNRCQPMGINPASYLYAVSDKKRRIFRSDLTFEDLGASQSVNKLQVAADLVGFRYINPHTLR